jgi:uncharacterized protein YjdB
MPLNITTNGTYTLTANDRSVTVAAPATAVSIVLLGPAGNSGGLTNISYLLGCTAATTITAAAGAIGQLAGGTGPSFAMSSTACSEATFRSDGTNNLLLGRVVPSGGSSAQPPMQIANLPAGGPIGTAAATVDINSHFVITQATAGQTVTIPAPTNTANSRSVLIESSAASTQSFQFLGNSCSPGNCDTIKWNSTSWGRSVNIGPILLTSIALSPNSFSAPGNTQQQLTVAFNPPNATNQTVNWTSSNAAVASVNSSGLVTTINPGTATITATSVDGNRTATASVITNNVRILPNPGGSNYTQTQLQGYYDAQGGSAAPDTVPQAVSDYASSLNTSGYKAYLGQNQWWYTNTVSGIVVGNWLLFGSGKGAFGANIVPAGIVTFK